MAKRETNVLRTGLVASFALSLAAGCAHEEGQQTSVSGTLVQSVGRASDGSEIIEYSVKSEQGWIRLRGAGAILGQQPPNRRVTATGRWSEDGRALVVEALHALRAQESEIGQASQALSTTAPQGRVAIFLIRDQSLSADPYSAQDVRNKVFNDPTSSNAYLKELSYGKYSLSGDVFGWYTADLSNCDLVTGTVTQQVMAQAAARDGFVTDNYRHAIHILQRKNGDDCGYLGLGTLGAPDSIGEVWSFRNDSNIVAHEIGHNLGLHHANAYICVNSVGGYISSGADCTSNPYADHYDGMASEGNYFHFNSYSKALLGWLPAGNQQHVTASGQFTLLPQETSVNGLQSLVVHIPNSTEALHVEMRKQYGFDSLARFDGAVLVRKVSEPGLGMLTYLLDMSPDTNLEDAGLKVGQVFQDPLSGIGITLVSQTASQAVVSVAFNGPNCSNGIKDGVETGVDCGNVCSRCSAGQGCAWNEDCTSGVCSAGKCVEPSDCTVQSAIDLGVRNASNTVASNACVKIAQYPSWWQWTNGLVTLQSGTGTFPIPATWSDGCTTSSSSFTFTSAWQVHPIGSHSTNCPVLIQLNGSGAPLQLSWW